MQPHIKVDAGSLID
jgi:hypothetical protein